MVLGKYIIIGGLLLALGAGTALAGPGHEQGHEQGQGQGRGHRAADGVELTVEQRQIVHSIMSEAQPRLRELRALMREKMQALHAFAYRDDGDENVLSRLGGELQALRDELRKELQTLDERLEREAGLPARPYMGRGCSDLATRMPSMESGETYKK